METQQRTIQVPKMTQEMQSYTTYAQQTIQEPIQTMVPQTQTVNTIQQINKVVEYARTPVNQYTVAGPTYTQPAQQQMMYQPQMQQSYAMPQQSYGYGMAQQSYGMPMSHGYSMPQNYASYSGSYSGARAAATTDPNP